MTQLGHLSHCEAKPGDAFALFMALLAGFVGRAVAPKAIGVPYVKER
jgi:hypothetical protein